MFRNNIPPPFSWSKKKQSKKIGLRNEAELAAFAGFQLSLLL
jgi:hypothetical protein